MRKTRVPLYTVTAVLLVGGSAAQTQTTSTAPTQPQAERAAATSPDPAPAPAPPPPPSPLTRWGMDFSFMLDGYTLKNFNNPPSKINALRNFDFYSNTADLNMAMISIDRAPAPIGFHLDVGFGEVFKAIRFADRAPEEFSYFKQAYVSFKPKQLGGFQADVGKFVTSAGAEVIEANMNWNYSRSILFAWAIPYYHFGLRTSFPIGSSFTGGFQLVQGWNNVYDNNSGKTYGFTGTYAFKKGTWSHVYYTGPEKSHTNDGWRQVYDTTLLVNPTDRFSFYVNFDYGRDKNIGSGAAQWSGIAGAARYSIGKFAVASRLEYFKDSDGFSTGTVQALKEFTLTGEYKPKPWLISRLEFRNDWSDQPFFQKDSGDGLSKSQPTILFGVMVYLSPKK
jgi:hypothetical protein